MDLLFVIVGAIALVPVALLVGVSATQLLIRVILHWDTSKPPPSYRVKLLGVELGLISEASDKIIETQERQAAEIKQLKAQVFKLQLERRLLRKQKDEET